MEKLRPFHHRSLDMALVSLLLVSVVQDSYQASASTRLLGLFSLSEFNVVGYDHC